MNVALAGSLDQRKESVCSSKSCNDTIIRLQKKSQELQRHLEKACRQLQHTVREHKSTMQKLKGPCYSILHILNIQLWLISLV